MGNVWLLLTGADHTASALPIISHWGEANEASYLKVIVTPNSHDALVSAKESSQQTYHILRKEGYLRKSTLIRYTIDNAPVNIIGKSAGLAFALAFVTKALPRRTFKAMAATGIVEEKGGITRIEGFPEKVRAALDTLPRDSQLYYPEQNSDELTPALRQRAQQHEVELIAVNRLEEAFEHLGVKLKKIYSYSPYRGLEVFQFEHAGIFFGRSREIETLSQQLNTRAAQGTPSVLVVGGSGSGKSSLVLAGVLPELIRRDGWPAIVQGRYSVFRPRNAQQTQYSAEPRTLHQELDTLFQAVVTSWKQGLPTKQNPPQPDAQGEWDTAALIAWLHKTNNALPKNKGIETNRFIWVVDQLEELFTAGFQPETIQRFCNFLAQVAKQDIWLILTIRNDYYDQYQNQTALMEHFRDNGQYNLSIIGREAIAQIIQEPAEMSDCTFETDRDKGNLADRIKHDVGEQSGILPLLEFTLSELYEHREKPHRQLTHQAYEAFGGLEGCIGHRAEAVYQDIETSAQEALPSLIRALSVVGSHHDKQVAARTIALSHYPDHTPKRIVIDKMTDDRLFIKEGNDENETQIRVAHEALLTSWPRASEQIEKERRDLELMRQLEEQTQRWQNSEQENQSSLLLHVGLPLTEAGDLLERFEDDLPIEVRDYIQASQQAEQSRIATENHQRKLRSRLRNFAVILIAAAAVIAGWQWWVAEEQRIKAKEQTNLAEERQVKAEEQTNLALARLFAAHAKEEFAKKTGKGFIRANLLVIESLKRKQTIEGYLIWAELEKLLPGSVKILPNNCQINDIKIHPKQNWLATSDSCKYLKLWDIDTGKQLNAFLHNEGISKIDFSPNGKLLAFTSWDKSVRVWDTETGKEIVKLEHNDKVWSVSFSKDGKLLITHGRDKIVRIFNTETWEIQTQLKHSEQINSVVFSPDSAKVATASMDKIVRLWDNNTGKVLLQIIHQVDPDYHDNNASSNIRKVIFSYDGSKLVTAGDDSSVRIWNSKSGKELFNFYHSYNQSNPRSISVRDIIYSSDELQLATRSADGGIRLWDTTTGREIHLFPSTFEHLILSDFNAGALEFSSDNKWLLVQRPSDNVRVVNNASGSATQPRKKGGSVLRIWELAKYKKTEFFRLAHDNKISKAMFSKDNKNVISAGSNIYIWNFSKPERKVVLRKHALDLFSLFRYERNIVKKNSPMNKKIWEEILKLNHKSKVEDIRISLDGSRIATIHENHSVMVWDIKPWVKISQLEHKKDISFASFSKDNAHILIAEDNDHFSKTFHVWNTQTGLEIFRVHPQYRMIPPYAGALFSEDDQFLEIISQTENPGFGPMLSYWKWRANDLIERTCSALFRNFTKEEWRFYFGQEPYQATCPDLPMPKE